MERTLSKVPLDAPGVFANCASMRFSPYRLACFSTLPFALAACFSSNNVAPAADAATNDAQPDTGNPGPNDASLGDETPPLDAASDETPPLDAASEAMGMSDAALPAWSEGPTLPVARIHSFAAAPGNGYLYIASGGVNAQVCNAGTSDARVFYAKQNADGSLTPWTETVMGPAKLARTLPGHVDANGFIYVAGGGNNGPIWDGSILFAKPNADGTIPAWTQATNSAPGPIGSGPVMMVANNMLFVGAGFDNQLPAPEEVMALYVSTLDATTGQPGTWTALANLPATPSQPQLVASAAGFAYFLDGPNTNVYIAKLSALLVTAGGNGDAGSVWTLSPTHLPGPTTPPIPLVWISGSTLYYSPGGNRNLSAAALAADGSIGTWSVVTGDAPADINAGYQGIASNGFFYALGDTDCNATTPNAEATYYVPIP
jgi:hypothetical protein